MTITISDGIRWDYFKIGVGHYIAGRFTTFAFPHALTGTYFHHAIEYFLKSRLLKRIPQERIKKEFGHNLKKLWEEFKANVAEPELDQFDALLIELDGFEKLRYPGTVAGYLLTIGPASTEPAPTGSHYTVHAFAVARNRIHE